MSRQSLAGFVGPLTVVDNREAPAESFDEPPPRQHGKASVSRRFFKFLFHLPQSSGRPTSFPSHYIISPAVICVPFDLHPGTGAAKRQVLSLPAVYTLWVKISRYHRFQRAEWGWSPSPSPPRCQPPGAGPVSPPGSHPPWPRKYPRAPFPAGGCPPEPPKTRRCEP